MVMKTVNDIIRDEIASKDSISDVIVYFSKLNDEKLNYILELILSDTYKVNFFIDHLFDSDNKFFVIVSRRKLF